MLNQVLKNKTAGINGKSLSRRLAFGAIASLALALPLLAATPSKAAETELHIVIKDHVFVPDVIEAPANTPIKLIVDNQDATPEEFESHDFNVEKIIGPHSKATIRVAPLPKGEYSFVGEFHEDTAKGKLIVK